MSATTQSKLSLPTEREAQVAMEAVCSLAKLHIGRETQQIQILDEENRAHSVELPTSTLRLLADILTEFAKGNAVKVEPVHAKLTIQEAADLLDVSRPHVVKLLEEGVLPLHGADKHHCIHLVDLMRFKARRDHGSEDAMAALAKQAQELDLGYGK